MTALDDFFIGILAGGEEVDPTLDAPLTSTGIAYGTGPLTYSCASTVYEQDDSGVYVPWDANVRPWNSAKGTTVNPAATNLITQSNTLSNWTATRSSVVDSNIAGIVQGFNKRRLTEDTATGTHLSFVSVSKAASSMQYTFSAIVESSSRNLRMQLADSGLTNRVQAEFNLSTGTVTSPATAFGAGWTAQYALILPEGNGVYRCVISATTDSTASVVPVFNLLNGAISTYTGDGTSGVYIHHAQLEQSAYHTSPIPTTGATVTRSAATCTIPAANLPSNDYVVYCESTIGQRAATRLGWGTAMDYDAFEATATQLVSTGKRANVARTTNAVTTTPTGFHRMALRFTGGTVSFFADGTKGNDATAAPVTPADIYLGGILSTLSPSMVRNVRIYPALTDAQMTTLTTTGET